MRRIEPICNGLLMVSGLALIAVHPAKADMVFPPNNPSECTADSVLAWSGPGTDVYCKAVPPPPPPPPPATGTPSTPADKTPKVVHGICGSANNGWSPTPPSAGLCSSGSPTALTDWHGTAWYWHCMGENGGGYAYCSTLKSGPTTCKPYWTQTSTGACSTSCGTGTQDVYWIDGCGQSKVTQQACSTQNCSIPRVDGVCGSGVGSCRSGTPIGVTNWYGNGVDWYWHCMGSGGGNITYCSTTTR